MSESTEKDTIDDFENTLKESYNMSKDFSQLNDIPWH